MTLCVFPAKNKGKNTLPMLQLICALSTIGIEIDINIYLKGYNSIFEGKVMLTIT